MFNVSLRRSSVPVVLFVALSAILVLFLLVSRDSSDNGGRRRWNRSGKSRQGISDKYMWTTRNCRAGMTMLIEMCPCISMVDINQKEDKVAADFVDCIYECVDAEINSTDDFPDDDDASDETADDKEEEGKKEDKADDETNNEDTDKRKKKVKKSAESTDKDVDHTKRVKTVLRKAREGVVSSSGTASKTDAKL